MVKIQVNSQGKAYYTTGGKALVASEGEKFGMTVNNFIGDTDANGTLQVPNINTIQEINFAGVKDIGDYALTKLSRYKLYYFYDSYQHQPYKTIVINNVAFPDLEQITGDLCCEEAFSGANSTYGIKVKSFSMPKLKKIATNRYALSNMFAYSDITNVDLHNLEEISGTGYLNDYDGPAPYMFVSSKITNVDLSSLKKISGYSYVIAGIFADNQYLTSLLLPSLETIEAKPDSDGYYGWELCYGFIGYTGITRLDFPALVNVNHVACLRNIFAEANNLSEVHFRADMYSTISALDDGQGGGFNEKFGGSSNLTIYFDL